MSKSTKHIVKVHKLRNKAEVKYIKDFIGPKDAKKLMKELKEKVPWTHGVYKMFGKSIKTPRVLYAMKDKDADITKAYSVTGSMEWLPAVEKLKNKIEKETGHSITYAQLNYYRSGDDYIGFHTDGEVDKGDIIASISLGATRKFVLRHKEYKTLKNVKKLELMLEDGSLLIMNDNAAKYQYKHSLPKMKNIGERINITFRPK